MSDKLRFGEMLVRAGLIERTPLSEALRDAEEGGHDLGELLVKRKLVDEQQMLAAISTSLNVPVVKLEGVTADPRALSLVPHAVCVEHLLFPVDIERGPTGDHLQLAMANPSDVRAIKHVTRLARLRIRPLVAGAPAVREAIARAYGAAPLAVAAGAATTVSATGTPASSGSAPVAGGGMFDFGVMDLSSYEPPASQAPAEPPPAPRLAATAARPDPVAEAPRRAGESGVMRGRTGRIGAGLIDALDSAAQDSLVGTADLARHAPRRTDAPGKLAPVAQSGNAGVEHPRQAPAQPGGSLPPTGGSPSGGLPPLPARSLLGRGSQPLPALPPGVRHSGPAIPGAKAVAPRGASAGPRTDPFAFPASATPPGAPALRAHTQPPASLSPPPIAPARATRPPSGSFPDANRPRSGGASEVRAAVSTPPHAARSPAPLGPPSSTPPPGGVGPDDFAEDDTEALDVRGVLGRFTDPEQDPALAGADEVIARYLTRYGPADDVSADQVFATLDRAMVQTRSPTGRLLVGLIRQLARRGLVDAEALLAEWHRR